MVPKGRNLKHQIDFVFCRFQPKEENSTEKEEILHFDPNSIIEQKHSSISATSHTTLLVQKNNLLVCWELGIPHHFAVNCSKEMLQKWRKTITLWTEGRSVNPHVGNRNYNGTLII